jgi:hypothetical protein
MHFPSIVLGAAMAISFSSSVVAAPSPVHPCSRIASSHASRGPAGTFNDFVKQFYRIEKDFVGDKYIVSDLIQHNRQIAMSANECDAELDTVNKINGPKYGPNLQRCYRPTFDRHIRGILRW